ncbi:hypothetical protein GCM10028771_07820 [Nocardioides marmoraquaticus]
MLLVRRHPGPTALCGGDFAAGGGGLSGGLPLCAHELELGCPFGADQSDPVNLGATDNATAVPVAAGVVPASQNSPADELCRVPGSVEALK